MDEQQYKATYKSINPQRCVFEKAINSRICNCSKAQRFNLADREGVACKSEYGRERCSQLISLLRENARFALQRLDVNEALAHTEDIKIQNGGLLGLQSHVKNHADQTVEDIDALISITEDKFKSLENLPYSQLMQVITSYRIRNRRKQPRPKKQK